MLAYYNQNKNDINFFESESIQSSGLFTLHDNKVNIKNSKILACSLNQEIEVPNVPSQEYYMIIHAEGINNNIEFADAYDTYEEAYNATPNKMKITIQSIREADGVKNTVTMVYPLLSVTENYIRVHTSSLHNFATGWKHTLRVDLEGNDIDAKIMGVLLIEYN